MNAPTIGRQDARTSWISPQTLTNVLLGMIVALAFFAWHLSLVILTNLSLSDVKDTLHALTHGAPVNGLPGHPQVATTTLVWTFGLVLLGLFLLLLALIWGSGLLMGKLRSRTGKDKKNRGGKGLAERRDVAAALGEDRARKAAAQVNPSKTARQVAAMRGDDLGFPLGKDARTGMGLWLGFEDSAIALGPTGAGKSSCIMEPAALSAPGALIVTTNEVGILDTIAATRQLKGRVWVFDPLERSGWPEPMVWNPIAGCEDGKMALARAKAFVAGCGADGTDSTNAGFFRTNAEMALKAFLHAAAIDTEERTMADVLDWCTELTQGSGPALAILQNSDDPRVEKRWAAQLESVAVGADDTVASSRTTLTQVVDPLTLTSVQRWVMPRAGVPTFDAAAFVASTDTLVLISDDSASTNVGPLATMLLQEVVDAIKAYAPFTAHGRIEPPVRIVGDEIANIAPLEKLPSLVTELRKNGVQTFLAFQSDQQAITRWGPERGKTLWEQAAAEIVFPGLKSVSALQRYSDLAGMVEVSELTTSFEASGERTGTSAGVHERKVLRPDEIQHLQAGLALVIYRNLPGIIAKLQPWYERPDAAAITAARTKSATRRHTHRESQRVSVTQKEAS